MSLLRIQDHYIQSTNVYFSQAVVADVLNDDPTMQQAFVLAAQAVVLAVYTTSTNAGDATEANGRQAAISVDGTDKGLVNRSIYQDNYPGSTFSIWIGTLAAGNHTIKGRWTENVNGNSGIRHRVLAIYIFSGSEYEFDTSAVSRMTVSVPFVDDTEALLNFTPSAAAVGLIIYNTVSDEINEYHTGQRTQILIDGVGFSEVHQSSRNEGAPTSQTCVWVGNLAAAAHTVKGQFASLSGFDSYITRRDLIVLLLDPTCALFDYLHDATLVSTANPFPVDDPNGVINRNLADARELLVMATHCLRDGTTNVTYGQAYGLNIDAADKNAIAKHSIRAIDATQADSGSMVWGQSVAAGARTIQGRYGNNSGVQTALVNTRDFAAVWLTSGGGGVITPKSNMASRLISIGAI